MIKVTGFDNASLFPWQTGLIRIDQSEINTSSVTGASKDGAKH